MSKALHKGIDIKLRIIGRVKEQSFVQDPKVKDRVELMKPLPYEVLPIAMSGASFGIIGRPNTLPWKLSIPVKLFDYIAYGLPVFAFGPPRSELQSFIDKLNLGMYVPSTDPDRVANGLLEFIKSISCYDRKHILRVARFFDRKKWAKKLVEIVENLL